MAILMVLTFGVGFVCMLYLLFLVPSKRLPPGPRPLPILGNLLLLKKFGSMQDLAMELTKTYGPIVTFWMGSTPAIIISGPELLQEAMIKQGHVFMGRVQLKSVAIVKNHHRGLTTGVGERRRFFRKLVVSEIFTSSRLAGFRSIRDHEGDILIESLKKQAQENGGVATPIRSAIISAIANLISGICFGRGLTLQEHKHMDEIRSLRFEMAKGKLSDFIPFLQLFPDRKGDELQLLMKRKVDAFFKPLIHERRRILLSGNAPEKSAFVDTLLEIQSQSSVGSGKHTIDITDDDIVVLCVEVLNGGIETTSVTLEYAIANLINHPGIQDKLFSEISAAVGDKVLDEDDVPKLPYLQAVVKETLRRHTPAKLAPGRVSVSHSKVAGYEIPANAIVFQHLEAISMSPQIWESPSEFRPERFLNKSVDFTGSAEISLIPFGVGRRICPAMNVGFLHAHLILGRLVQAFVWKSAIPGQLLNLTPRSGLSAPMMYPASAVLEWRRVSSM